MLDYNPKLLTNFTARFVDVGPPAARLCYRIVEPADYRVKVTATNWLEDDKKKFLFTFKATLPDPATNTPVTPRGTVILLHGYGLAQFSMLPWALCLAQDGWRCVLVDLRGHGRSTGRRIYFGTRETNDLSLLLDTLARGGQFTNSVDVVGESYGAALALRWKTVDPRVHAVVAIAPYASLSNAVMNICGDYADWMPRFLIRSGLRDLPSLLNVSPEELDMTTVLKRHPVTALFVAGADDNIAPAGEVERLHSLASPGSKYIVVPNATHEALTYYFNDLLSPVVAWLAGNSVENQSNQAIQKVHIHVDPGIVLGRISPDFIGFGYETSAVAQTNYFSGTNPTLIQLYRNLSSHGLIRIGGNVSDHTQYIPDGQSQVHTEKAMTVINQADLVRLSQFVAATGWKVMWGLNLGTGTREQAVQEAVAVDNALGNKLQSFQIGNEVELLPRFQHHYEDYHAAYLDYKAAIRAALPSAPFSGPDSIGTWNWITNFANTESGDLKLLTHHYYRGGAKDQDTSLAKLLGPDKEWLHRLGQLQELDTEHGLSFRINEVNSFWGGGKAGVSDTFGSALWCLDYMYQVAAHGGDGVNMETDINQLGWISHYSPIVHEASGECRVRPEYYGMLAFALSAQGDLIKLTMSQTDINLSAYATKGDDQQLRVVVINKDLSRDADVQLDLPAQHSTVDALWLRAPSAMSRNQVTLGGAAVSTNGTWAASSVERLGTMNRQVLFTLPKASAVLLHFKMP